jgi:hypothetical protein
MARVRSRARVTRGGEEAEAAETAPISEVMRRSGLIVAEGAADKESPAAETEQVDFEEGDGNEGEIDYDIIMPSKPSHMDFGKSTVSEADMTMMTKLGYFRETEKGLVRFGEEETIPKPEDDEVVVFKSFFKAGLRFPLHRMIAEVLEKFGIYLHQLTPNAIVRLSVYIWALRSQGVEPLADAFCRVHELHYETKAREDGLHENFGYYNFAYRKDMKTPVVSYRTKWPTGWKSEWFYVKIDEEKEKLVQSPLKLIFGLTRPQCNMTPGDPCQDVVYEFRIVSEHIGTRDLVQEYLANRVFLTLRKWGMPKLEEEKKEGELVRLPYHFKFKKHFKEPCQEWLDTIEVMCNEILGNYTKKEDQLMTATFGSRSKRRLNRVMDALHFEYPDYERLNKGVEGQKRKRFVSVVGRQAARMVKEDEEKPKKRKLNPEPTAVAPKKRKVVAPKQKATDIEETPTSSSATDVAEILKLMTKSLPIKLSPLAPHLTKLFPKKKEPTIAKKAAGPKKQRIITVTEAIEETPRPASASKAPAVENTAATEAAPTEAATAKAEPTEDANLESTLSNIDKILLDMAAEEAAATAKENTATVPEKVKEIVETTLEEENFNFQNLIGQELMKAEKEELREYAISCGYQPGALLFGGVDGERLGCLRDQTRAKVINTLSKSIGFSKLETDISRYRRQHIVGSLFYSNFKVKKLFFNFLLFLTTKVFSNEGCFCTEYAIE